VPAYGVAVDDNRRQSVVPEGLGQALLIFGLIAFEIVGTFGAAHGQPDRADVDPVAVALVVASGLPLLWRRRYPIAVLAVSHAVVLVYLLLDYPRGPIFLSPLIAFFSAVLQGQRVWAWTVLAAGFIAETFLPSLVTEDAPPTFGWELFGLVAWLLVIAGTAEVVRVRRERSGEAARTREEEALRRASEERLRIARELHDVLAHNISLINVQAGVALHLLEERPEQARPALTAIKQASKEALTELRSVLGVLRRVDDEDGSRDPAPTLVRIDDLVSHASATGLHVTKQVQGSPRPLPAPIDVAAFRIVQEALTNVVRHAGASSAIVTVTYEDDAVTVEVADDGRGSSPGSVGSGSGIVGMRERAESVGGSLEAGPRAAGGFRVHARLPFEGLEHRSGSTTEERPAR
jgi:signal transduction histidine kinase